MKSSNFDSNDRQFGEYLRILWRRKWIVVLVGLIVFGISAWRTYREEPLYQGRVTIQLGVYSMPMVLSAIGGFQGGPVGIDSELAVLKSRIVAERTAVRLQRHYSLKPLPPGVFLEVEGVRVTDKTIPGTYTLAFTGDAGQFQVSDPGGNLIGVGKSGQPFEANSVSFTISKVSARPGGSVQILIPSLAEVGDSLRQALMAVQLRGTNIVELKVEQTDAREAARTANAFAEAYVDFTREQRVQQMASLRQFLKDQLASLRQDLQETGQALSKAGIGKRDPESILANLAKSPLGAGDLKYELAKSLLDMEMQRAAMQFTYTPNHLIMAQLDRRIGETRNRLSKHLQEMQQDPQFLDLLRESDAKLSMYNYMLQEEQKTRLAEAAEVGSARIIDRAVPPKSPSSPNISRNMRVGGILGLSLGIGLALLIGYADRSIKNASDLGDRVGLPAYGSIPEIEGAKHGGFFLLWDHKKESDGQAKLLLDLNGENGWALEAYRSLRTNIKFAVRTSSSPVFLFTSARPGEGKSLTVANLAIAMGQTGGRILIVDVDLRRPIQHRLFGLDRGRGLTDVLAGDVQWKDVVRPTKLENVHVITCGGVAPDPAELLGSEAMRKLLEEVQHDYDLVFLDSPPLIPYTDGCALAPVVGGILLVVQARITTGEDVARAQSLLTAVNARVTGVVLNGVSSSAGDVYYYRYGSSDSNGGRTAHRRRLVNEVAHRVLLRLKGYPLGR